MGVGTGVAVAVGVGLGGWVVGVVVGLVPPTGVSLPFISAGRTSLIVFMASVGILLNISKQREAA